MGVHSSKEVNINILAINSTFFASLASGGADLYCQAGSTRAVMAITA
jgi:hypothetical protein